VGAGPAGAALAVLLSRQGLPVTLLEASVRFDRQFRGQGLMPSGLAALRALALDPLPAWLPRRPLTGWSFVLDRRPFFSVQEPMGSADPCTLIEAGVLVRRWYDELGRRPSARRLTGQPVVGLLEEGGRVCGVTLADGTRLRGALVVGCDGRDSTLRRLSGLPFRETSEPMELLWFRLRAPACRPIAAWLAGRFVTLVGPGGSGALFQRADDGVQLGWVPGPDPGSRSEPAAPAVGVDWRQRWAAGAPAELAALLRALPRRAVRGPVRQALRVGLAERWHRPGLLLLGDAAHPMSPVRAQGLNMALRDAVVAAAHLGPALGEAEGEPRMVALATALARLEGERLPEIRAVQALQAEELGRAELLRRLPWLRATLAATAPLSGPLLARRWRASQRVLRDGLAPLPEPQRP
jgi:2-polyprenyl-6-methoxyphenol hydroxylase-like FAD-dependent oxidoreductase